MQAQDNVFKSTHWPIYLPHYNLPEDQGGGKEKLYKAVNVSSLGQARCHQLSASSADSCKHLYSEALIFLTLQYIMC